MGKNIKVYIGSLCCLLAMLCSGTTAVAQDALAVLGRVADNFRKSHGVEVAFQATSQGTATSGKIRLKGDKFVLEATGMKTWFDGHTQWTYLASAGEVTVTVPSNEELQTLNPYAWISVYRQQYRCLGGKESMMDGHRVREVTLVAADAGRDVQRMTLWVDTTTYRPLKLSIVLNGADDATVITLGNYRTGLNDADSFFRFNAKDYPTVEVIDLT